MSRVAKFTRKKNKALSIFEKTRRNLLGIVNEIRQEQDACAERIEAYHEAILAENAEVAALGKELESTNNTIQNINSILE